MSLEAAHSGGRSLDGMLVPWMLIADNSVVMSYDAPARNTLLFVKRCCYKGYMVSSALGIGHNLSS